MSQNVYRGGDLLHTVAHGLDNLGLAPLKSGASLVTAPQEKAELLLNEFSSVFSNEDVTAIPWLGPASAKIPNLTINSDGVAKLLSALKSHKAAGPDRLPNLERARRRPGTPTHSPLQSIP